MERENAERIRGIRGEQRGAVDGERWTAAVSGEKHGRTAAVVLAGGRGSRMKSQVPKQYIDLCGRPLIYYALKAFEDSSVIDEIVLVAGRGEAERVRRGIVEKYGFSKVAAVTEGGAERYDSVNAGLACLAGGAVSASGGERAVSVSMADYVLIHDGARPLVDQDIIARCADGAEKWGACVAAVPVKDTIKVAGGDGFAAETPNRSTLWAVQTPQAFSLSLIRSAYGVLMASEENRRGITDDAMVAERFLGAKVRLVEGSYSNIKVTTPEDIAVAEALLRMRR